MERLIYYRIRPTLIVTIISLFALTYLIFSTTPAKASSAHGTCQTISKGVALAPGRPINQTIVGELCVPRQWASGSHGIDIMVHGATYNRQYWHWPQDRDKYSQVDKTLQAGRATFIYDRLGSGESNRPFSTTLSFAADAYSLHQLIQWLRADYPQITVIGHSLGSMVAIREAADYNDADRLVVTGIAHPPAVGVGLPLVLTSLVYPATLDPQFPNLGLDVGYMTTQPGTRGRSFFNPHTADPAVIAYDEAHKDVISATTITGAVTELALLPGLNAANRVRLPVLVVLGQQDVFCGLLVDCTQDSKLRANEAPYYTAAATFTVRTIPNTAHNLTLHPSAGQSHAVINEWIINNQ